MDMAVEYRQAFGPIEPGMTWHEVLSHVRRVRGLEVRQRLILADGAAGFGQAGHNDGVGQIVGNQYQRLAFPEHRNAEPA